MYAAVPRQAILRLIKGTCEQSGAFHATCLVGCKQTCAFLHQATLGQIKGAREMVGASHAMYLGLARTVYMHRI